MATGTITSSADPAELQRFQAMAAEWWDPEGKFRPLHMMNPCRLDYTVRQIAAEHGRDLTRRQPFAGLSILDIGCGGGLMAEPMARLGAEVTGVDAAPGTIPIARVHAEDAGLEIDYREGTAEEIAAEGHRFDALIALEVIEHVTEPLGFLGTCAGLMEPGAPMILSTLNRTAKSYLAAIVGAERVLRWLPPGTHDWQKFLTPDEVAALMDTAGLDPVDRKGMVFDPLGWHWRLSARDLSVNYIMTALKR